MKDRTDNPIQTAGAYDSWIWEGGGGEGDPAAQIPPIPLCPPGPSHVLQPLPTPPSCASGTAATAAPCNRRRGRCVPSRAATSDLPRRHLRPLRYSARRSSDSSAAPLAAHHVHISARARHKSPPDRRVAPCPSGSAVTPPSMICVAVAPPSPMAPPRIASRSPCGLPSPPAHPPGRRPRSTSSSLRVPSL
ncbi:hypothetical protein E2562_035723 [Oryza meyeriana var. granulata]|uniref:Uncharacterized protein n=1 Tax=Oryza meyeriana var. granulata TaxID=110450 RepID=A0A6G1E7N4_9ORYZ|nr:hypothetical protein E2562_035723 [Oryza meyeriana var. granulata]